MEQQETIKKKIRYCRINRYTAIFLVEKKLLSSHAQIMGKGLTQIGLWEEVTANNTGILKLDKNIADFVIRRRNDDPINEEDIL